MTFSSDELTVDDFDEVVDRLELPRLGPDLLGARIDEHGQLAVLPLQVPQAPAVDRLAKSRPRPT